MRTLRALLLYAVVGAAAAPALHAQILDPGSRYLTRRSRPSTTFLGLDLMAAQPVGEFDKYIDVGGGIGAHLIQQLDPHGIAALRVDLGFVVYGSETKRVPLAPRIEAEVNTDNTIFLAGVGPQLMVPSGRFRPYVTGAVGLAYFSTSSSISGVDATSEHLLNTTNFDDATFAWSGAGGLYIPVRHGARPISIDLGVRYHQNGVARYLREGSIQDNPDNTYTVTPIRSQANLLTYHLGVTFGL